MPFPVALLSSALKQFGAGMLVAGVFGFAVVRMYEDLERKNDVLVALVREQTLAAREVSEALREILRRLEN
jgi:prophage DNA circulation protein